MAEDSTLHIQPLPSAASDPRTLSKIKDQVEYYFGDINLPRDKFLQGEIKKETGWISLDTMLKFNRLSKVSRDIDEIAKALADSELIEVSSDKTKIRRNPEVPIPDDTLEYWQEIRRRTVYLKGFPLDVTLDELQEWIKSYGPVQNILMRRFKPSASDPPEINTFKGSIFATFPDIETASKMASFDNLKFKGDSLTAQMQEQYVAEKKLETQQRRASQRELKQAKKNEVIADQKKSINETFFVKNCVLSVEGLPPEAEVEGIKEFFKKYGDPIYVKISDNGNPGSQHSKNTFIRFGEENEAVKVWQRMCDEFPEGKVRFDQQHEIKARPITGEEEQKYWAEFNKAKLLKFEVARKLKQRKRQKLTEEPNKGSAKHVDVPCTKKSKRIVFDEDGAATED